MSKLPTDTKSSMNGIKGGYWLSKQADQYHPIDIPSSCFTHVFYASVGVDPENYRIIITPTDKQWMKSSGTRE